MSVDESMPDRMSLLTDAFGDELAKQFDANLEASQKAHYDAYKHKVALQRPIFEARSAITHKVKQFWSKSIQNCRQMSNLIDPVDEDVISHLEDVRIEHDEKDPRNWEITFTFAKNPYFTPNVLSKKFSIIPPSDADAPTAKPYDLEAPLYLVPTSTKIEWTSPDHDLLKKAPKPNLKDLEEFDEFSGLGSFFHLFETEGEDETDVGETLLEWYAHAVEYAAGMSFMLENDNDLEDELDEFDEDDEDDDSEDDLKKEIDLEEEEELESRPKKKPKKN